MDGTLVDDAGALSHLNVWFSTRRARVTLVYLTGRHYASALELIDTEKLLPPDILVTDVGSEIRFAPAYQLDMEWKNRVSRGWTPAAIRQQLADLPGLTPQPLPSTLRLGYYTAGVLEDAEEKVRGILEKAGLPGRVVASTGGMVDVLPAGAGKGPALSYLQQKMGWDSRSLLVCGDSGNDLDMLTLGFATVLVGNAAPELAAAPLPETVYRARRPSAGGIFEALQFYGFTESLKLFCSPTSHFPPLN
ncbi:hypothetical protein SY88_12815 [Clostridiales bacterium PH28_bin88]|nr:hypothetical protein SY88_12815 [Clostridiales bacterium PH28_bin88]